MPLVYDYETVYKAELAHDSIYFVFTNSRKSLLSIMRADIIDDDWTHYTIGAAVAEIRHSVTSGTWIIRMPANGSTIPTQIMFKKKSAKGCVFKPHIHETNMIVPSEDVLKGRHYGKVIEDDMVDAAIYSISMQTAKRRREGIITGTKEVKNKMEDKSLFHVILFNRKTEEIEFDKIIPAKNEQAAVMQAAQLYGKYDSKAHLTIVWQIQYSEYATID